MNSLHVNGLLDGSLLLNKTIRNLLFEGYFYDRKSTKRVQCWLHHGCLHQLNRIHFTWKIYLLYKISWCLLPCVGWSTQKAKTMLSTPNKKWNQKVQRFLPFRVYLKFFEYITLQCKHNVSTLSVNITIICTRLEIGKTNSLNAHFPSCF